MSYLLERTFTGMDIQPIFARPAYYYSNWLPFVPTAKQGVLPTYYPVDLRLPMLSPLDVTEFISCYTS